jgi:hypothetical protein
MLYILNRQSETRLDLALIKTNQIKGLGIIRMLDTRLRNRRGCVFDLCNRLRRIMRRDLHSWSAAGETARRG